MSASHDDLPVEYIRAGLALIPIPFGVKGPLTRGWQLEQNAIRSEEQAARLDGGNVGLAHRWSGTCAVDIDDYQQALPWLAQRGIDLQGLLLTDHVVQIRSGKPNRAKLLYRLPDGVEWLPTHKLDGLELRCASRDGATTVQDVLPPSVHPDTGRPYEWIGNWRNIPPLPDALLKLWRELSALDSWQGPPLGIEHDPVLAALDKRGKVLGQIQGKLGGWSVRCPWESGHTGQGGKADTAYFEPHINGYAGGAFKCLHSHCANRGIRELHAWLGIDTPSGAESAPAVNGASGVTLERGDALRVEPIWWLWDGWLARGKVHVLAGAPGTGKSTVAIALAAVVTTGGRWPDGMICQPANVLVWSGEDDPADTLLPRLLAAGGDRQQFYMVTGMVDPDGPRPFDPATDMGALLIAARNISNLGLAIIDPVVSAVVGDSHKNTEVRRALQPLVGFAVELGVAVVGISHFSKGTAGRDPVERVTGSVAFGALPRVVMATARVQDADNERRIFCRAKSNIGPDTGGWDYRLDLTDVPGTPGGVGRAGAVGRGVGGLRSRLAGRGRGDQRPRGAERHG